jgi:hypothetical protein
MGSGNEYATAFDGETGAIVDTVDFPFPYGAKAWGALPVQERGGYVTRIEPLGTTPAQLDPSEVYWLEHPWGYYPWGDHQGNRANRYLGAVALLDGEHYSAVSLIVTTTGPRSQPLRLRTANWCCRVCSTRLRAGLCYGWQNRSI